MSSYTLWQERNKASNYWNKLYIIPMYLRITIIGSILLFFIYTGLNASAKYPSIGEAISMIFFIGLLMNVGALIRYLRWRKRFLVLQLEFTDGGIVVHTSQGEKNRIPFSYFKGATVTFLKFNKRSTTTNSVKKNLPLMEVLRDDFSPIGRNMAMIVSFGAKFETEGIHLYIGNISNDSFQHLRKEWFEKYVNYMKNDRVFQRKEVLNELRGAEA